MKKVLKQGQDSGKLVILSAISEIPVIQLADQNKATVKIGILV